MRHLLILILAFILSPIALAQPAHPLRVIREDASLLKAPAVFPAEGFKSDDPRIRPLFFEGKPCKGQPTRIFAWIGSPRVEPRTKVPGIVLIHGGGGTAFDRWVKVWLDRGYAAIAMDTCGQVPVGSYGKWKRAEQGGPPGWDNTFKQIDEPQQDQWPYHAVCDVLLAHSLLRSQEGVDPGRIGVTGISWGGYLTCLVAGADPRFKFAAPVYGCGYIDQCTWAPVLQKMTPEQRERWIGRWDPRNWLPEATMPMLWVTGTNDFAYPFDALQKSYRLPKSPRTLCIRLRMPHGHGPAGENPAEILAFADSILKDAPALIRITAQSHQGREAACTFEGKAARAELLFTKDTGAWQKRRWETLEAKIEGQKAAATLPEGTKVYYLNVIDGKSNVVGTEHEELP